MFKGGGGYLAKLLNDNRWKNVKQEFLKGNDLSLIKALSGTLYRLIQGNSHLWSIKIQINLKHVETGTEK